MNVIEIVKRKWNGTQNIPKSAIEKGALRKVAVSDITERKEKEAGL